MSKSEIDVDFEEACCDWAEQFYSADSIVGHIRRLKRSKVGLSTEGVLEILEMTNSREKILCRNMKYVDFRKFLKIIISIAKFNELEYELFPALKVARNVINGKPGELQLQTEFFEETLKSVIVFTRVKLSRSLRD